MAEQGYDVNAASLGGAPWLLDPPDVEHLMLKIKRSGVPLIDFIGSKPFRGVLTGFNEAFVVNTETKEALVAADPGSADILKPFLRGQDIRRWRPDWAGLWILLLKSSGDQDWPWSEASSEAEATFRQTYPAIHAHLKPFERQLRERQDKGRFWWELRTCAYYEVFERPKIAYQEIQFFPSFAIDQMALYGNNKIFFLMSDDLYLLSVLNSPLMWWHNWRYLGHMKDEALNPAGFKMEVLPIAVPGAEVRAGVEQEAARLVEIQSSVQATRVSLRDWLRVEHGVEKASTRLGEPFALDPDAFVAEVRRARGRTRPLSASAVRNLIEEHAATIVPVRRLLAEAERREAVLADLVHRAYGLTPEDVDLMWRTAPPRMPGSGPVEAGAE